MPKSIMKKLKKAFELLCAYFQLTINFYDIRVKQNNELLKVNTRAEDLVIFIVPVTPFITGGLLSIVSLYNAARQIMKGKNSEVVFMTYPSIYTHYDNKLLKEMSPIFRFSQIPLFRQAKNIMIHLPEIYASGFYSSLSLKQKNFLASKNTHINILNQNIELMPAYEQFCNLQKISKKLTQTTAHIKNQSQEICDKYQIPLHYFSVHIDSSIYQRLNFSKRRKVILLSSDEHPRKDEIVKKMQSTLKDYEFIVIKNMTFHECMNLTGATLFSITFGEGFDGYLINGSDMRNLCFAVYNTTFFPNDSFLQFGNIYESYQQMFDRITEDVQRYAKDEALYNSIIDKNLEQIHAIYSYDKFMDNQKRFYLEKYDYYPVIIF